VLQIAHFDIKPANINYSPSFSKPIFLDFGFTRAIATPNGKMKLMNFVGTIGYCSDEMNDAYFS
jgi:serine/threonine protein kinase